MHYSRWALTDLLATPRRRILYAMHVDWRWIRQRPHFLAAELAKRHEVQILHRGGVTPARNLVDSGAPPQLSSLLPLPWSWRALRPVTVRMQRAWVARVTQQLEPDVVWITHPRLLEVIPAALTRLPVVYDCMDDALGFPASSGRLRLLAGLERNLAARAVMIHCSSLRLCELLASRYGPAVEGKINLVRNGLSSSMLADATVPALPEPKLLPSGRRKLAYIGTVAEWIDFGSVVRALNEVANVEFHFVGPVVAPVPKHERLYFHRPVSHSKLRGFAAQFDGYVMPFLLGPLVECVDPVKLYEYLAFGKEVLAVRYPEVERFSEFVHFYREPGDLVRLVRLFESGALGRRNTPGEAAGFLARNTWESRGEQVACLLAGMNGKAVT